MTDERLTSSYDYALPPHLIAQQPASERDASRLMVLRGDTIEHHIFRELPNLLRHDDLLVFNETRVIAARLFGTRESGGKAEILLLRPATSDRYEANATRWLALVKPSKKLPVGSRITLEPRCHPERSVTDAQLRDRNAALATATIIGQHLDGVKEIEFKLHVPFEQLLAEVGTLPLPPYIHNDSSEAQNRYQTVFARVSGSVAAPTASLHFTPELLQQLRDRGIESAMLTLDVGLGTFRPVKTERLDEHHMHAESYTLPAETVAAIERAKAEGRRVVAVGTTVTRTLEGNILAHGRLTPGKASTDCFITPGFQFRVVDAMITNFHLPKSTLLALVSAFAGRERVLAAYREAVGLGYRFFSFGDAMLIERSLNCAPAVLRSG